MAPADKSRSMNIPDSTATKLSDVPFLPAGAGHYIGFLCPRCLLSKGPNGRRLQPVQGVRQYVCAGCVK